MRARLVRDRSGDWECWVHCCANNPWPIPSTVNERLAAVELVEWLAATAPTSGLRPEHLEGLEWRRDAGGGWMLWSQPSSFWGAT